MLLAGVIRSPSMQGSNVLSVTENQDQTTRTHSTCVPQMHRITVFNAFLRIHPVHDIPRRTTRPSGMFRSIRRKYIPVQCFAEHTRLSRG